MTDANRPADWKHFDDFAAGIATNRLATTDALSGTALTISLKNGRTIELTFNSGDEVAWREGGARGVDWYEAINVAPDVVFINMTFSARPAEDEAFIVNVRTRRVLSVRERVRGTGEALGEPRVLQEYTPGIIGDPAVPAQGIEPASTRELIGLTAHYEYSPQHVYEHIYLRLAALRLAKSRRRAVRPWRRRPRDHLQVRSQPVCVRLSRVHHPRRVDLLLRLRGHALDRQVPRRDQPGQDREQAGRCIHRSEIQDRLRRRQSAGVIRRAPSTRQHR